MKRILPNQMKIGQLYQIDKAGVSNEAKIFLYLEHENAFKNLYVIKTTEGHVIYTGSSTLFSLSED
jgi:hypothetical protein